MTTLAADSMEVEEFLDHIRGGASEMVACFAVGWTPARLRAMKADEEFLELASDAKEYFLDAVETVVGTRALAGNRWAVEMVLYNRRPTFWRPPAHKVAIEHTGTVSHELVATAVEATKVYLAERGSIEAMQQRAIEARVSDD